MYFCKDKFVIYYYCLFVCFLCFIVFFKIIYDAFCSFFGIYYFFLPRYVILASGLKLSEIVVGVVKEIQHF